MFISRKKLDKLDWVNKTKFWQKYVKSAFRSDVFELKIKSFCIWFYQNKQFSKRLFLVTKLHSLD